MDALKIMDSPEIQPAPTKLSLVEQIAALKKATADRLVALAAERKLAILNHQKNLQRIDDEVAALAPKQKRNRKPKAVAA
jgi:hypothetical protein